MSAPPGPELLQALRRLDRWKAVRPGSAWLGCATRLLEDAHCTQRIITALGDALIVHPRARAWLGQSRRSVSDTVACNAIYQQDSVPALHAAGFRRLRPGQGIYRVVDDADGTPCPLVGQLVFQGYSRKHLLKLVEALAVDLMVRRATLVALYPVPPPDIEHRQLRLVHAPPQWPDQPAGT